MGTLTETAYYTRKAINWSIVVLVAFFVLRFMFGFVLTAIKNAIPEKPIKPDNRLGQLQEIVFPETSQASPSSTITYRLATLDGTLPEASETAKVYFMPKERPNFLGTAKARTSAAQLGFTDELVQKDKTLYQWTDQQTPLRTLTMDILSKHLTLRYKYEEDISVFTGGGLTSKDQIINKATDFLQRNQLLPFDIDLSRTTVTFLKFSKGKLVPIAGSTEAHAARVDFFRTALDNMPVVTLNPKQGIISITLSNSIDSKKSVLELVWQYWPISYDIFGRYALVDINAAWGKLQSGDAYIASSDPDNKEVTIRNVYLAYYDSYESQIFFQPVFVFSGDDDFVAYVPAIAPH